LATTPRQLNPRILDIADAKFVRPLPFFEFVTYDLELSFNEFTLSFSGMTQPTPQTQKKYMRSLATATTRTL